MSANELPAGIWVLRRIEQEALEQGTSISAFEKWMLKREAISSSETHEITKRTVSLIRSSISRAKRSANNPVILINERLTIPKDWFESYQSVFLSRDPSLLSECLQKAFKGCPEWGETEPWSSPEYLPDAEWFNEEKTSNSANYASEQTTNSSSSSSPQAPIGLAGIVLSSISIFVALIGGGALAVPFGLYGISQGRKIKNRNSDETATSRGTTAILLGITGIVLGVVLLFVKLSQSP